MNNTYCCCQTSLALRIVNVKSKVFFSGFSDLPICSRILGKADSILGHGISWRLESYCFPLQFGETS